MLSGGGSFFCAYDLSKEVTNGPRQEAACAEYRDAP
jgi:hypothetical protein